MNNRFSQLSNNIATCTPTDGGGSGRRTPTDGGGSGRHTPTDGGGSGR